jgi:hypothetical protein
MRWPHCHSTNNKVIDSRPSREAEEALDQAGITVNKNAIPFDQRSPRTTSGIRIGTPALTTRGMKEPEMEIIAGFIHPALSATTDAARLRKLASQEKELCRSYPLFAEEWTGKPVFVHFRPSVSTITLAQTSGNTCPGDRDGQVGLCRCGIHLSTKEGKIMAEVDYLSKWLNSSKNKFKDGNVLSPGEITEVYRKLYAQDEQAIRFVRSEYQKSLDVCEHEIRELQQKLKKAKTREEKDYFKERIENPYKINVREYKMKIWICDTALKSVKLKGCRRKNSAGGNCEFSNLAFVDHCIYHQP